MVDETRNQMMQNLFGDQSEDEEEEEEEVDSEHHAAAAAAAAANHSNYQSDEGEGEAEDDDGEGEGEIEGQEEVEVESEAEAYNVDLEQGESEGERAQSSPEREVSDQKMESEPKDAESEEEGYGQRVVATRRREVVASESDESEGDHEDEEMNSDQHRQPRLMSEQKDHEVVRDVFGDSDEDEPAEYGGQDEIEQELHRSPMEEEANYERDIRPEDIVPDDNMQYASEDDNFEEKPKDKPVGPPLDLEFSSQAPPGRPEKMNVIKVSNIMGIEPKPFDPKTYVEEDVYVTDESGAKKRIRLEDNIVRWRRVKNRDGTVSYESNARFVRWKDGSLQLLIGNEVLDISVHDALQDQSHLFLRHGKGLLQSQGRLLQKMKFMPSSLSSKSHRLLTALVDSRHKKVYKVKNCITEIDPEKEKEEKERVEGQTIRANGLLHRKREKVNRKYSQPVHRGQQQLSPGFLEDALDEEDEADDYYSSHRTSARSRFEEDLEAEARAERRIINLKKSNVHMNVQRKPSVSAARQSRRPLEEYSESERVESEYESDGAEVERSLPHARDEPDHEDEYEEEADEEAVDAISPSEEDEDEEPRGKMKETGSSSLKRKEIDSGEESPPRKTTVHRRKAVVFDSDDD
ncbi:hypothetical protein OPV22_017351 [Ensete ventricosum]|uniref:RNA polymerase-associated protein LEO1 n=1 Tax=Ensete ventricosum TaxID=4639 RepID=A0AAV8PHM8_ENSVE|nr:hypothetical protein OPV22_017351 [Ensete ventricosum]